MSPGPGYSVGPYFHSPSALFCCSAHSPKSNNTSIMAHPTLCCLWVAWCSSQQSQLPPHPSWMGGEEQTPELEAEICILKSYLCLVFFPRRGTSDSEHAHHPMDATAVLWGCLSVPRALSCMAR